MLSVCSQSSLQVGPGASALLRLLRQLIVELPDEPPPFVLTPKKHDEEIDLRSFQASQGIQTFIATYN